MIDRIDEIADGAIRHTRTLLASEPSRRPVALEALTRILDDLRSRAPNHPGAERLRRFIAEMTARDGDAIESGR